ncbi:MAG: class I SAM-dependent methyltransferase [Rhodobacteraceae bacterium]|nr:class I SAM-dependent methyltransferase [Paracoccaceae bacterium]
MTDPVLETLLMPLVQGNIDLADNARVLFLRARHDGALKALSSHDVVCEQSFAPDRDSLKTAGYQVEAEFGCQTSEDQASDAKSMDFDLVMMLPPRQKQEARALMARAVSLVKNGGIVLACTANTEGAKAHESDLKNLAGLSGNLSKNKCRVYWTAVQKDALNASLLDEWKLLDAPRPILEGAFVSRPGIFAWDRVDVASKLLAAHIPQTLAGRGADLGCGFGYLSRVVLERCPKVIAMDLYEAEKRALDLARENLQAFSHSKSLTGIWSDVTRGIEGPYDFIVSNPPFHQTGKADRSDIGQAFIRSAARGLRTGGQLFMVANRHLPYEDTLKDVFGVFDMIADEGGYKVLKAIKRKVV